MTERSINAAGRRRAILEAAARVFARKGFHAARVADVASEAGVAHGLLYHYFTSKDEVLETVFRESWGGLLEAIHGIEAAGGPARDQLRKMTAVLLRAWLREPDLVRVLIREITRSPDLQRRIDAVGEGFQAIERIVDRGRREGEFRPDVDARLASFVLYGGVEAILTGWVHGYLPGDEADVARAEAALVELVFAGLTATSAAVAL